MLFELELLLEVRSRPGYRPSTLTGVPGTTKMFERLYPGRTAVDLVNARLKVFWGAENVNIAIAKKCEAMVGAVKILYSPFAKEH